MTLQPIDQGQQIRDTTRKLVTLEGMALNFIAPSISNGIARAVVDKVEVANLKSKWQFSCAMFLVGYKPSLTVFTSFVKAKWPLLDNISAILHEDGYFLVGVELKLLLIQLLRVAILCWERGLC